MAAIVNDPLLLPADPGFERLPARERLRNVALSQFAERGIDGTTVRGVARAAGVSPSLLQHHFVTKEGLRRTLGADVLTPANLNRTRAIMLGVFEGGLGQGTLVEEARKGIARYDEARITVD